MINIRKNKKTAAAIFALLAALFYAINTPFSKVLLNNIEPAFIAALLYLGAGIGVGIMYLFQDFPYTIGMILLDIAAPIFLMIGINIGSASNASLTHSLYVCKEPITK